MLIESLLQSILVYQPQPHVTIHHSHDVRITSSIVNCMSEATSRVFGLGVICLPTKNLKARQTVLELCHCLKTHPSTKDMPIVVSIDFLHRGITMKLIEAGINYMEIRKPDAPIDPESLHYLVLLDDPSIRIDRILGRLCPCIRYQSVDDHCELTTCKAYENRMVLGGRRLHEVCETDDHIYCDYFLCPRLENPEEEYLSVWDTTRPKKLNN